MVCSCRLVHCNEKNGSSRCSFPSDWTDWFSRCEKPELLSSQSQISSFSLPGLARQACESCYWAAVILLQQMEEWVRNQTWLISWGMRFDSCLNLSISWWPVVMSVLHAPWHSVPDHDQLLLMKQLLGRDKKTNITRRQSQSRFTGYKVETRLRGEKFYQPSCCKINLADFCWCFLRNCCNNCWQHKAWQSPTQLIKVQGET